MNQNTKIAACGIFTILFFIPGIPYLINEKFLMSNLQYIRPTGIGFLVGFVFLDSLPEVFHDHDEHHSHSHDHASSSVSYIILGGFLFSSLFSTIIHIFLPHNHDASVLTGKAITTVITGFFHALLDGSIILNQLLKNLPKKAFLCAFFFVFHDLALYSSTYTIFLSEFKSTKKAFVSNLCCSSSHLVLLIISFTVSNFNKNYLKCIGNFILGMLIRVILVDMLAEEEHSILHEHKHDHKKCSQKKKQSLRTIEAKKIQSTNTTLLNKKTIKIGLFYLGVVFMAIFMKLTEGFHEEYHQH